MADRGDGDYELLRKALRSAWRFDPERQMAMDAAKVPYTGTDKRYKWMYICAMCGLLWKKTEVERDHIEPCGKFTKFEHRKHFLLTLFCRAKDNLQILCKGCHKKKTKFIDPK